MEQPFENNKRYVLTSFPDSVYPDEPADFSAGINRITHCNILARKLFLETNPALLYTIVLDKNETCIGIVNLQIFGVCVDEDPKEKGKSRYNGQLIQQIAIENNASKIIIVEAGNKPSKRFNGLFGNRFPKSVKLELEKIDVEFLGYHYITSSGRIHIKKEN